MSQLLLALLEVWALESLSDPRDVSATFGTFGKRTLLGSRLFVGCLSYFWHFWKLGPSKAIVTHGMSQLLLALLEVRPLLVLDFSWDV